LRTSALAAAIDGKFYMDARPVNSNLVDVVVTALPITNEQLQAGVLTVNIFVPKIPVSVNSIVNQVPDHLKLRTVASVASSVLSEHWSSSGYHFSIQQQLEGEDDEANVDVIMFRIDFFSINV
jgi:hypothetical protein